MRDALDGMATSCWNRGETTFRPDTATPAYSQRAMFVSSNYFSTIGVVLPLGPGFTAADDASVAKPEAVISHRMWQLRFGGDPGIIGRTVLIDRTEHVVVGVAPERFRGHVGGMNDAYYQLWLPLSRDPRLAATEKARTSRESPWVRIVARLAEGTTVAQADARAQSVMAALAARFPSSHKERIGGVEP